MRSNAVFAAGADMRRRFALMARSGWMPGEIRIEIENTCENVWGLSFRL